MPGYVHHRASFLLLLHHVADKPQSPGKDSGSQEALETLASGTTGWELDDHRGLAGAKDANGIDQQGSDRQHAEQ